MVKAVAEGAAALTISDTLKVESNVLVTPQTTINISNIATLAVIPIVKPPTPIWPVIVGIIVTAYVVSSALPASDPYSRSDGPGALRAVIAVLALLAIVVVVARKFKLQAELDWRLLIGASDGSRTYFTSSNKAHLDRVRDLLTEKINKNDTAATYNINVATGDIQVVHTGAHVGAMVAGSGNQVATGNGRVGTTDVVNSPGAMVGDGNTATGNSYHVDYSRHLPVVSDWGRHFAQQGHQDLARRLAELEGLMKSGTPTPQSKGRVRDLARELTSLLGGAADIAQFFGAIVRLAT
jgi:hypothetical protein